MFQPNGCTVKDGIVYMVESQADRNGSLGTYDIDNDEMSYSFDQLTVSGDGLVASSNYLFMSSWSPTFGKLMSLDLTDDDAVFETVVEGMVAPADIAINEDEKMIALPSLFTGAVYFVEYDDDDDDGDFAGSHSVGGVLVAMVVFAWNVC